MNRFMFWCLQIKLTGLSAGEAAPNQLTSLRMADAIFLKMKAITTSAEHLATIVMSSGCLSKKCTGKRKGETSNMFIMMFFSELTKIFCAQGMHGFAISPQGKPKKKRRKSKNGKKRGLTGYTYFFKKVMKSVREKMRGDNPTLYPEGTKIPATDAVRIIAKMWRALSKSQKEEYKRLAGVENAKRDTLSTEEGSVGVKKVVEDLPTDDSSDGSEPKTEQIVEISPLAIQTLEYAPDTEEVVPVETTSPIPEWNGSGTEYPPPAETEPVPFRKGKICCVRKGKKKFWYMKGSDILFGRILADQEKYWHVKDSNHLFHRKKGVDIESLTLSDYTGNVFMDGELVKSDLPQSVMKFLARPRPSSSV